LLAGVVGGCQKYDNDKKFNLANIETFHITNANQPTGRNFNFTENDSAWMTGLRVYGNNMYITNRGNSNLLDSNTVFMNALAIDNADGIPAQDAIDDGGSIYVSDGFDLDPTGTKLLIAGFTLDRVYSATLTTAFDFSTIGSFSTSPAIGNNPRGCVWGNGGAKFYTVGGLTATSSSIRAYNTASSYSAGSASYVNQIILSGSSAYNAVSDINISADGTKAWLSSAAGYLFYGELSTPWSITTLSIVTTVDINSFYASYSPASTSANSFPWVCGVHWNEDGTKLYVLSLWGQTDSTQVSGVVSPPIVEGTSGFPPTDTNTFAVIEFRRK